MSNIKESEKIAVASRITGKVDDYSIAKTDVANTFNEIIDLLGAVLVNVDIIYPKGFVVYTDSPFSVYVAQVNDVTGDTSNATNWLKIAGSGLPYLVSNTEVYDAVVVSRNVDYYINVPIDLNQKAGSFFALRYNSDGGITNVTQMAFNITVDARTALEGTSIVIQINNMAIGLSLLSIQTSSGTYNEKLGSGCTYLLTKTTDIISEDNGFDLDGYILTKLSSSGYSNNQNNDQVLSIGKFFIQGTGVVKLPLAIGLHGEEVILISASAGTTVVNTSVGDVIVNLGGLPYTLPYKRFTSDGNIGWYYTA